MAETYPINPEYPGETARIGYKEVRLKQIGTNPDTFKELKKYNPKKIALELFGAGVSIITGSLIARLYQNHNKK